MKFRINLGINNQTDKDKAMSHFICLYLIMNAFNSLLQDVYGFKDTILSYVKTGITVFLMLVLLRTVLKYTKKELKKLFLWEFIGLFIYFWSFILGVSLEVLSPWAITTLTVCIPMAVTISNIKDKGILYKSLLNASWIILFILFLNMTGTSDKIYDMHFSYGLLLVILLHLNEAINNNKKILILFVILELLMLVLYGSRGAIICIGVYLALKIFSNVENKKKRTGYLVLLCSFGVIFYLFMNNYAETFYEWLLQKGYYSRTLKLLFSNQFISHDSGRKVLWDSVLKLISEKPFLGWGIRGAIDEMGHPYPHNLFLDCWLTFGCFFGTILIALLVYPIYRVITVKKGIYKDLLQILFSISFVSLMFSGTFFTNYYYYMFMGLILSVDMIGKRVLLTAGRKNIREE